MDISLIFKIAGLGILLGILNIILEKSGKEEFAYITTLIGLVIVFGILISLVSQFFNDARSLFQLY